MRKTVGVIVGRFQVPALHDGHQYLLNHVLAKADMLVVLLGVSPVDGYTAENPLTFAQREMILRSYVHPVTVFPLPDRRTNEEWSQHINTLLGTTFPSINYDVTLYGGRDSFIDSYSGPFHVERVVIPAHITASGTDARAAIKEENSPEFFAGQIYALQRQFPHAYPTVDVAMLRPADRGMEALLIQRADSGRWCFPGGFVDPTDKTLEGAAVRELSEEIGLVPTNGAASMLYAGSTIIDDFRYRGSRDKIMTTLFVCRFAFGRPMPNYNEVQDYRWVLLTDLPSVVSETHQPLVNLLRFFSLKETINGQPAPAC